MSPLLISAERHLQRFLDKRRLRRTRLAELKATTSRGKSTLGRRGACRARSTRPCGGHPSHGVPDAQIGPLRTVALVRRVERTGFWLKWVGTVAFFATFVFGSIGHDLGMPGATLDVGAPMLLMAGGAALFLVGANIQHNARQFSW